MTTRQENKLSMYLAVIAICNDLTAILSVLPQFTDWFTKLNNAIKNIKTLSEAQELDYKGKTETKSVRRTTLIDQTMEIIRRVMAYANVNDLYELKQEVDYSASDLKRSADTVLRTMCQVVNERTTGVLSELAPYGVTQAMLDEQQSAIDDYFAEITSPREGVISRKNATSALVEEFRVADEILIKRLDKLVGMLKTTIVDAYNSYMSARMIIDLGRGKKNGSYDLSGQAVDFENGMPLSGVSVSIVGTTSVVMTGVDGLFKLGVESAGDYSLRAEKEGYKALVEGNVIAGDGQEEVVLEMVRIGNAEL